MWFSRNLKDVLKGTKKIKVKGVMFEIKKLDSLNFLDGSRAMTQLYDVYKPGRKDVEITQAQMKKVRAHYIDTFMGSVVRPELSRDDSKINVNELFLDQELYLGLYEKILEYSYGKKKVILPI